MRNIRIGVVEDDPQAANWYLTISTDINRKMASNLPFPYSTTAHES